MSSYAEFIAGKQYRHLDAGFDSADLPDQMMDFQRDCVAWACRRGAIQIGAIRCRRMPAEIAVSRVTQWPQIVRRSFEDQAA